MVERRLNGRMAMGYFLNHSQISNAYRYIAHTKQTFKEEYLEFLKKFNVSYDERSLSTD